MHNSYTMHPQYHNQRRSLLFVFLAQPWPPSEGCEALQCFGNYRVLELQDAEERSLSGESRISTH